MNPNFIDAVEYSPDWFIFSSFEEALKRYFELEHSVEESELDSDDRIIFKLFQNPPWDALADVMETEDIQSFLNAVSYSVEMAELRQVLNLIIGNTNSSDDAELDLYLLESTQQGFINPNWYRRTYSSRTQGMERKILQQSPLVHYVMLGANKGWSLSPFFDEFFFINASKVKSNSRIKKVSSLSDRIGLARYLSGDYEQEISPFFSVNFYLLQCKRNNILFEGSPIIHFITTGINLGLAPHPDWDEDIYLNENRDVKLSSQSHSYYGWIHWCMHGRFEKRKSGFTKRVE